MHVFLSAVRLPRQAPTVGTAAATQEEEEGGQALPFALWSRNQGETSPNQGQGKHFLKISNVLMLPLCALRRVAKRIPTCIPTRGFAGFPGVDGQYSQTQSSLSENLAFDLNKNSKLHAIVLSIDVLTGSNVSRVKPPANSSTTETADSPNASVQVYDRSKEVEGVTDVTTKYMKKLHNKLPGGVQSLGNMKATASKGDGDMFKVGRALSDAEEAKKKSAGVWMLVPGMGALLDYCAHRTMRIGLVSTYSSSEDLLEQFVRSYSDFPFDVVLKKICEYAPPKTQRERAQLAGDYLRGILASPNFAGLLPKQIMIVTTDDALLWAAKDIGFFTVKYRDAQGLYGQVSTDFIATSALEVQDALEELNGVALRVSAFSHRV